jgi:16S rRNA (cytosine1402-N4)-methyltransferase
MTEFKHVTVLLKEAIEALNVKPDGVYVDATLGGGGHSQLLASKLTTGKLWSFDQDETAITFNQEHLKSELAQGKIDFMMRWLRMGYHLLMALFMIWVFRHHNLMMVNAAFHITMMPHLICVWINHKT